MINFRVYRSIIYFIPGDEDWRPKSLDAND